MMRILKKRKLLLESSFTLKSIQTEKSCINNSILIKIVISVKQKFHENQIISHHKDIQEI
jgi:hypothetical protein